MAANETSTEASIVIPYTYSTIENTLMVVGYLSPLIFLVVACAICCIKRKQIAKFFKKSPPTKLENVEKTNDEAPNSEGTTAEGRRRKDGTTNSEGTSHTEDNTKGTNSSASQSTAGTLMSQISELTQLDSRREPSHLSCHDQVSVK
ncbi:unnamed protein product [Bursaphelenchus okinawaensis]|uniref:Uncharacterized protein n=1 Tax=Bursaphelenchus okinawaensis TaxID=465554 RepID=A0A811KBH2_9BILA|nr:unnamed protein product [Bursaphelenchus okinawaensis]CAG9100954.1 unnamed protein product [Bursaphelenchus okinawaensis]